MNEKITENIVRKHFEKNKIFKENKQILIEEQKSENPKINKLLMTASKGGLGIGRPEFIISFPPPYSDFLIVIECKANINNHVNKNDNTDKYKDYAVDGVLLYSTYLSNDFDVLSIAVSGQNEKELKVSHFLQLKNLKSKELPAKELLKIDNYLDIYLFDSEKEKKNYESILEYSSKLNDKLRDLDLSESHRPLLISGILIALEDVSFRSSYSKEERPSDLASILVNTIEKVLDKQNIQGFKKDNMKQSYGFIKTHSKMANPDKEKNDRYNTLLKDLIQEIESKLFEFTKTYKYIDVIGKFYSEFLRYANGDKSLGIVLTPRHITDLFVELSDLNENSIVLDNCTGTAGFLISSMKKMITLCNGNRDKEKAVYENQLIGIESQSNMFSLACSNMMIRGDGKANIYYGSCFDKVDEIKKEHKPTVGLLNPPYSKKGENLSEWHFILNNLECLVANSLCLAIIPISCVLDDPLKEKVLENHTLEAVMSMPEDLFLDLTQSAPVTCIVVIRAHQKHPKEKKTWLGYWRRDGFVKSKSLGRIDKNNEWDNIRNYWISSFKNREVKSNYSCMVELDSKKEWCIESYLKTDYSKINKDIFRDYLQKYLAFRLLNNLLDIKNKVIKTNKIKQAKSLIRLSDLFDIFNGISKSILLVKDEMESDNDIRFIRPSQTYDGSIDGYVDQSTIDEKYIFPENTIYVSTDGQGSHTYSYLSSFNFIPNSNVSVLIPKNNMNINEKIYYVVCITANRYKFSYGRKPKGKRLKELLLPNQCPDFVYEDIFNEIFESWKKLIK